jgi:hypothetical protein
MADLPKRTDAELHRDLRIRAALLTDEKWEAPATAEMMREAADMLVVLRQRLDRAEQVLREIAESPDPGVSRYWTAEDAANQACEWHAKARAYFATEGS